MRTTCENTARSEEEEEDKEEKEEDDEEEQVRAPGTQRRCRKCAGG